MPALVEIDGRAAMNLDGNTDGFDITSNIQGAYSIFTIGNPGGNDRYYQDSSFGSRQFIIRNSSVAGNFSKYQNGTATSYLYDFRKELVEFISNAPTILYTNTLLMRFTNSGAYLGDFSEYIIYTSDKSGTNQTSIQENIGDYYTQNTPLLDTYSGAAAAYSLRLLDSTYTGFAIKVQDNVGGATLDIGFNVFGELDTVSLSAYGGSNDVFVETWYDQSGNSNNAVQATSANRPKIYDGATGAVITENGKPTMEGNNAGWLKTSAFTNAQPTEYFVVTRVEATGNWQTFASIGTWSSPDNRQQLNVNNSNKLVVYAGANLVSSTVTTTGQYLLNITVNGSSSAFRSNGVVETTGNLGAGTGTGSDLHIMTYMRSLTSQLWRGNMQELVLFPSDQSSNRTDIETNINTFYSIY